MPEDSNSSMGFVFWAIGSLYCERGIWAGLSESIFVVLLLPPVN